MKKFIKSIRKDSFLNNTRCFYNFIKCICYRKLTESVKQYSVKIIRSLPHNTQSFTQGFLFYNGKLYESTGLNGRSSVQCIDAQTGIVEKKLLVPNVFAEGLARWDNQLIQLTWRNRIAFIYKLSDFTKIGMFRYATEGWGLTSDNRHLIMSDGSDTIYFRNPSTFNVEKIIHVSLNGNSLKRINELEYVDGCIYANIWYKNFIALIDSQDGKVVGHIDASKLFDNMPPLYKESTLNGIAYNKIDQTFYLTGKLWPTIFEVDLVPKN
jgi:glutamine cyclotransferase